MTQRQFLLPDLGEGLPDAEIVRWLVAVGETVTVNQPLVEVETAKAVVEVPSPFAGTVVATVGEPGTVLPVGQPLVTVDIDEPGGDTNVPAPTGGTETTVPASGRTPVLVGYGPHAARNGAVSSRRRRGTPRATSAGAAGDAGDATSASAASTPVLAKPPVRKLARGLGVDLATVRGTGPHGTISRDDVEQAAASARAATRPPTTATPTAATTATATATSLPSAAETLLASARVDPETRTRRIPVTGVRRATARAMVDSAFTAPHVTEFVSIDATATQQARQRLAGLPEFAGVKVTPLLFAAKALLVAARRHPLINSSWDGDDGDAPAEIVVHDVVNLGIAVATPRGLLVPNVADAGSLSLAELARSLDALTAAARSGRVSPADLRGGTITITNVGSLGVDTGTPLLNPGEAAILALGSVKPAPWVHEGELAVRTVAQLALSFDHRIIDGALGSAVLADVAAMMADPTLVLAWS